MNGPLPPGTMLGPYRVIGPLGAGGMGAVYRATDTVLRRDVALKVVEPTAPGESAAARLLREARRVASLSHPNICTVYHVTETEEPPFIAMELVDGPTLYSEIRAGRLAVERACRIGRQIADALEHAHRHGIVHRDLKSTNVMLTASGQVKVVDFGIAGLLPGAGPSAETVTSTTDDAVAGTVPYMAPEVLRGQAADARSDLWSLGVVLFEMLAGHLPFSRTTGPETVAAILRDPVPALPRHVPPAVSHIVQRCLAKEPAERPGHASDVSLGLEVAAMSTPSAAPSPASLEPGARRRPLVAVAVVALAAVLAGVTWLGRTRAPETVTANVRLANPVQVTRAVGVEEHAVWSPDGRMLAYSASPTGNHAGPDWDVWVTQPGGTPINRTADHSGSDMFPSWSPDGAQIAFWSSRDGAGCYVMPALGGAARRIAAAGSFDKHAPLWSNDGRHVSCITGGLADLVLTTWVVETGQVVDQLPLRVEGRAMFLAESPDRRRLALITSPAGLDADITQLVLVSRPDGATIPLSDGQTQIWSPSWSADGALNYVSSAGASAELWRQQFDAAGALAGPPVVLSSGVGMRNASVSPDGTRVAYSQGRRVANLWRVPIRADRAATWSDATQITFDQAFIEFADVSPDGRQLAISSDRAGSYDLWVLPSGGGEMRQVTSDRGAEWSPRWSPDGGVFAFYASRSGNRDLWTMPVVGGPWTQLTTNSGADLLPSWSPDGREVAHLSSRDGVAYLWATPAQGGAGREIVRTPGGGRWSPDGRRIAFMADGGLALRDADRRGAVTALEVPAEGVIWSAAATRLIYVGRNDERDNLHTVSTTGGGRRPLTDLRGRRGGLVSNSLASDGRSLYFSWQEDLGDIWVADLAR